MSISIWDYEKPLDAMMLNHDYMAALVLKHEQQIKDLAAHLLELKQSLTTEFKQPTKICGPNLEETLNAAGFYRKKEWVGLTDEERRGLREWQKIQEELGPVRAPMMLYLYEALEAKLKEKNT